MPLYEEIEIEDMTYDPDKMMYSYPCPCGDRFKIYLEDLWDGEDQAGCDSCTLFIEVIYDEEDLPPLPKDDSDEEEEEDGKPSIHQDAEASENDNEGVRKATENLSVSSQ